MVVLSLRLALSVKSCCQSREIILNDSMSDSTLDNAIVVRGYNTHCQHSGKCQILGAVKCIEVT